MNEKMDDRTTIYRNDAVNIVVAFNSRSQRLSRKESLNG